MQLKSLHLGDHIRTINEDQQPAGGYEVVGVDLVGQQLIGPCVVVDWEGRGLEPFGRVKAGQLDDWELMIPQTEGEQPCQ